MAVELSLAATPSTTISMSYTTPTSPRTEVLSPEAIAGCLPTKMTQDRVKRVFDGDSYDVQEDGHVSENNEAYDGHSIVSSTNLRMAGDAIAPFLSKHIPEQYAPVGVQVEQSQLPTGNANTRYCYRHRHDLKCRRQADEQSMKRLQKVPSLIGYCLKIA